METQVLSTKCKGVEIIGTDYIQIYTIVSYCLLLLSAESPEKIHHPAEISLLVLLAAWLIILISLLLLTVNPRGCSRFLVFLGYWF